MSLTMLMYASVSRLRPQTAQGAVEALVKAARVRNAVHGITGSLLFTEAHFVEILEGPAASIEALWQNLQSDPRHGDLVVADHGPVAERRFDRWDLAYSGPAQYVSKRVRPLFDAADPIGQARSARWMVRLMQELNGT